MIHDRETVFKLFKIPVAEISWDILVQRIHSATNIDGEIKSQLLNAVAFLRKELGKGFFDTCGFDHPLKLKLESVPNSSAILLPFVGTLKKLKSNPHSNYPYLLRKLTRREDCKREGMFFMDVAAAYVDRHFDVAFLEEHPTDRRADIQIDDPITNEHFQIEVTEINDSVTRARTHKEHVAISNVLINHGFDLFYSSQQLQHIPDEKIVSLIEAIKQAKDDAYVNKAFIVLKNEYVHLAVAHPAQQAAYNRWCQENNRQSGIGGLRVDFNDTRRILQQHKISKEAKHFPKNVTGLVYMPVALPYFLVMNPAETITSLAAELEKHPSLLGLVLYSEVGQLMDEQTTSVMEHAISSKHINGYTRYTIFINNDGYRGGLSAKTVERIKRCIY